MTLYAVTLLIEAEGSLDPEDIALDDVLTKAAVRDLNARVVEVESIEEAS